MKHIYKLVLLQSFLVFEIYSQEIVDSTIDLSVQSSNLSIDAQ